MERVYGKKIDILKLKQPVLNDLKEHLNKRLSAAEYLKKNIALIPQKHCYICGSEASTTLVKIHGFQYVQCSVCSHVYTSERYPESALQTFYQKDQHYAQATYANRETCFYRREHVARPKVEFALRFTDVSGGRWIDVGSGVGDLVSVLRQKGWEATGIEISETSVHFAKEVFDVSLDPQTFEDYVATHQQLTGTVDVISFMGVLEHVVNPMELLNYAWHLLKPGGILMTQTPNAKSFSTMVQQLFPEQVFRHLSPVEHIMVFTEQSLLKAMALRRFEPLAFWFHGLDFYELIRNLLLLDDRFQDSTLLKTLLANINTFQLIFDQQELSDLIICIAKKTEA